MKRREFLKTGGATALALGLNPLRDLCSAHHNRPRHRLILVELTGGNDGLGMVVPLGSKKLRSLRPTLALPDSALAHLDDSWALHPNLAGLVQFFKKGRLAIVNNVGYLPSDRSHFRSLDVWHSGVSDRLETQRGWLGRQLAAEKKRNKKSKMGLFHLGSGPSPLCFQGSPFPVTALRSLSDLKMGGGEAGRKTIAQSAKKRDDDTSDIAFLKRSTQDALAAAKKCEGVETEDSGTFSNDPFGKQLALVSSLSRAFDGDQVYFTQITGFDTHAVQRETQPLLLASLSRGLVALMKETGKLSSVSTAVLVYSEFGRRVQENASRGTDHGAAGPCLVLGDRVKGGIYGGGIDLDNLMGGDLRPQVDFRSVYAELTAGALQISRNSLKPEFGPKVDLIRRT